jgi:formate/nitrite transporter FocA (FNT family)
MESDASDRASLSAEHDGRQSDDDTASKRPELEVAALVKPSAPTVYQVISETGREEMNRSTKSLWWSGVAAGLSISLSLYVMAALRVALGDMPGAAAVEKLGYSVGFLVVVLGRLQLFTENTITPVLPVLHQPSPEALRSLARIWLVVLFANLAGTLAAAALPVVLPVTTDAHSHALLDISMHFAEHDIGSSFFSGIPAGFLVAAMVWMLPSSKGFEFWTILIMTYVIAVTNTSHVVVGSTELFTALLNHRISASHVAMQLAATGLGNVFGGTGLFAILAYAQVSDEL